MMRAMAPPSSGPCVHRKSGYSGPQSRAMMSRAVRVVVKASSFLVEKVIVVSLSAFVAMRLWAR